MDNLSIAKIAAQMEEKGIPLSFIKNRTFDESKTVTEIVSELESDYKELQTHIEKENNFSADETVQSLKKWGENQNGK